MKEQYYNNIQKEIETIKQAYDEVQDNKERVALENQILGLRKAQQIIIKSFNEW